ncbi:MAG: hypothetical protein D6753_02720 [Planctomycetota bacterium]|nr:MAG: hypothetical protein D6753_02720 [Planctomycetota bacterium]
MATMLSDAEYFLAVLLAAFACLNCKAVAHLNAILARPKTRGAGPLVGGLALMLEAFYKMSVWLSIPTLVLVLLTIALLRAHELFQTLCHPSMR